MIKLIKQQFVPIGPISVVAICFLCGCSQPQSPAPNFLVLMADNMYYAHLGCYGDKVVQTPTIDELAKQGVRFTHAFCAAPSCTPARGAMLAGQDIWRLGPGANLHSSLPADIPLYTDLLEGVGYQVGHDRKGWGPGDYEAGGRPRNPAGYTYQDFATFLDSTQRKPWCYMLSSRNPHRPFSLGAGIARGMDLSEIEVPPYLPDVPEVRSDIADYYEEVEQFDQEVAVAMELLRSTDQLKHTVVIVCADNGWMMPRGLANLYDFGVRVPLIVSCPDEFAGGRVVTDMVSLNDVAPTICEVAGIDIPDEMTAQSLLPLLSSDRSGRVDVNRNQMVMARERHAICRTGGLGYPGRAIRTDSFLLILNLEADRWPAGEPPLFGDIDLHMLQGDCPTKEFMMENGDNPSYASLYEQAFLKRPPVELFDLREDPYQMQNLAADPAYASVKKKLNAALVDYLVTTGDPRFVGNREAGWDADPYYKERDWIATPRPAAQERFGLKEKYFYR